MNVPILPALCSVTFRALAPQDVIALAAAAGLAGIEWGGDVHVPPGDLARARQVGEQTRAGGLAVLSYGSYIAPPTDGLAEFSLALTTAKALGAPNIRLWPGTRGRDSVAYSADERAQTVALLQAMATQAAATGITVGLEYHPGALTDTAESAARLMAEIAHPNVFLYWQPRPGQDLADRLREIAAVGADVSHVHVFAWDGARRRFPLADEAAEWRASFAALVPGRWHGPRAAMLEFVAEDDPERFAADAAVLRAILTS